MEGRAAYQAANSSYDMGAELFPLPLPIPYSVKGGNAGLPLPLLPLPLPCSIKGGNAAYR